MTSSDKISKKMKSAAGAKLEVSYTPAFKLKISDKERSNITHPNLWPFFKTSALNVLWQQAYEMLSRAEKLTHRALPTVINFFSGIKQSDGFEIEDVLYNSTRSTAGIAFGIKKIDIHLASSTSINSKLNDIRFVLAHEISHRVFDGHRPYYAGMKYCHHREYIANAFAAIIVDKKDLHGHLSRLSSDSSEQTFLRPSALEEKYALANKVYENLALELIDRLKTKRFKIGNSWVDFIVNKDRYLELQSQVEEGVKQR